MRIASVQEIMATRARATFSHRINFQTIGYDNLDQMREWCHRTCQGLWRCETHHALYWQFEEEQDATMFMLRWGGAEGNKIK
jgi:hypothetical protein